MAIEGFGRITRDWEMAVSSTPQGGISISFSFRRSFPFELEVWGCKIAPRTSCRVEQAFYRQENESEDSYADRLQREIESIINRIGVLYHVRAMLVENKEMVAVLREHACLSPN